jgi:predicted lipase
MAININTTYTEILTMIYLSKLIYYYHKKQILININETLEEYFKKYELIPVNECTSENSEYMINCDNNTNKEEEEYINFTKDSLLFLYTNFPKSKIYNFISNDYYDIQAGIVISDNIIVIVFKGTDSLTDCFYDLTFVKRNIDLTDSRIHKGFYDQLMSIYDELISVINELLIKFPNYNIKITGHSAGGAHGTIFTYLLANLLQHKQIKLITFGSPKIGNIQWAESFNNMKNILYYRITNHNDIITIIPRIYYKHVGLNIHLDTTTIYFNLNTTCNDECYCNECKNNSNFCYCYYHPLHLYNLICDNNTIYKRHYCIFNNLLPYLNFSNIHNHSIEQYYHNFISSYSQWEIT